MSTAGLPGIENYVLLRPPFASVVVGRTPVVMWHETEGGARRSAFSDYALSDEPENYHYKRYAKTPCGVARVNPDGTMTYIETRAAGEEIGYR